MKRLAWISLGTAFLAAGASGAIAQDKQAGDAAKQSVQASGKASASAAHSVAASGKVTSAMSAVPLSVGGAALGSAAAVTTDAARDSARTATAPIGTPLEITDEAITVVPPNEALKAGNKPANR